MLKEVKFVRAFMLPSIALRGCCKSGGVCLLLFGWPLWQELHCRVHACSISQCLYVFCRLLFLAWLCVKIVLAHLTNCRYFDLNILDLFWFYAGCVSFAWISSLTSLSGWGVSNNSQGISRPLHCKYTCHLGSRVLFNKNTVINLDVLGKSIVFCWHVPLLWAEWNMVRKDSYSTI